MTTCKHCTNKRCVLRGFYHVACTDYRSVYWRAAAFAVFALLVTALVWGAV